MATRVKAPKDPSPDFIGERLPLLRELTRSDYHDALIVLVLTQIALVLYIQFPRGYNFDEFHYIPAAKKILSWAEYPNYEHPPLAKFLIAIGLKWLGDQPTGWRIVNAIFGAWTLAGLHLIACSLFTWRRTAVFATVLTGFNMLFYVQSRIAMLDGFMVAFLVWGLFFLLEAIKRERAPDSPPSLPVTPWWAASGVCIGLATACKWMGIVGWGAAGLWTLWAMHQLHSDRSLEERARAGLRIAISLILLPLVAYFATFLPFYTFQLKEPWNWLELFRAQARMWDGQLRVVSDHPYHSSWLTWPWMTRPIWFVFDKELAKPGTVRGVLMIGNPAVMWPGLVALIGCLGAAFTSRFKRERQLGVFIAGAWLFLYFSWGLIPRKISFYYYYYPAALFLSFALAAVFETLAGASQAAISGWTEALRLRQARVEFVQLIYAGIVIGLFLHFLPILAAFRIPGDAFRQWMWLKSWI